MKKSTSILPVLTVLLALVASAWGGLAFLTRAQGTPEAAEFTDVVLSDRMTGATVLALGEATHGNAEFQDLRLELTRKAAPHGFRTIVLEEDVGSVREADVFVRGGPGTAREAALRLGFTLNHTGQVADWLQWIRDHNAAVPETERITLVGMDVQRVDANKRIALAHVAAHAPGVAEELRSALAPLHDDLPPEEARTAAHDVGPAAEKLVAVVDATPEGAPGRRAAVASARALADHAELELAEDYQGTRERMMFDHLRGVVEQLPPDGGVLLFGHNGHVAKQPSGALRETVGRLAEDAWGENYRVIGTDYVTSRFLSGQGDRREEFRVGNRTPLRGMYEGTRVGYLEIAEVSEGNRELFDRLTPMGSTGEGFTRLQAWVPLFNRVFVVPSRLYDAVILVDEAGPVTML